MVSNVRSGQYLRIYISAESEEIGNFIGVVMNDVGMDGVITIE